MAGALNSTEAAQWMREALMLAQRGAGTTSPNPMVGALVIEDGVVVGTGYHKEAGGPHAEIFALRDAAGQTQGSTLIVTLEPCSHYGRTPPCTEAIIAAGIARVIIGVRDPNPQISGRGVNILREHGIEVVEGVEEAECAALIRPFKTWITERRPYTILKLACSIDGKVATKTGESQWITGDEARQTVHQLRSEVDAIMVGRGTAEVDNPRLTARGVKLLRQRQPDRVILDSTLSLDPNLRAFDGEDGARRIVFTSKYSGFDTLQARGVEVHRVTTGPHGLDLTMALRQLATQAERPTMALLVEGGAGLATALLRADLVDELRLFVGPLVLGSDAMNAVGELAKATLAEAPRFTLEHVERHGGDVEARYIRER